MFGRQAATAIASANNDPQAPIKVGDFVLLMGLVRFNKHLNGQVGKILKYKPMSGTFTIALDSKVEPVKLQRMFLTKITDLHDLDRLQKEFNALGESQIDRLDAVK